MAKLRVGQIWKDRDGNEVQILEAILGPSTWEKGKTYYQADNGMIYRDHFSSNRGKVKHIFSSLLENKHDLVEILGNW